MSVYQSGGYVPDTIFNEKQLRQKGLAILEAQPSDIYNPSLKKFMVYCNQVNFKEISSKIFDKILGEVKKAGLKEPEYAKTVEIVNKLREMIANDITNNCSNYYNRDITEYIKNLLITSIKYVHNDYYRKLLELFRQGHERKIKLNELRQAEADVRSELDKLLTEEQKEIILRIDNEMRINKDAINKYNADIKKVLTEANKRKAILDQKKRTAKSVDEEAPKDDEMANIDRDVTVRNDQLREKIKELTDANEHLNSERRRVTPAPSEELKQQMQENKAKAKAIADGYKIDSQLEPYFDIRVEPEISLQMFLTKKKDTLEELREFNTIINQFSDEYKKEYDDLMKDKYLNKLLESKTGLYNETFMRIIPMYNNLMILMNMPGISEDQGYVLYFTIGSYHYIIESRASNPESTPPIYYSINRNFIIQQLDKKPAPKFIIDKNVDPSINSLKFPHLLDIINIGKFQNQHSKNISLVRQIIDREETDLAYIDEIKLTKLYPYTTSLIKKCFVFVENDCLPTKSFLSNIINTFIYSGCLKELYELIYYPRVLFNQRVGGPNIQSQREAIISNLERTVRQLYVIENPIKIGALDDKSDEKRVKEVIDVDSAFKYLISKFSRDAVINKIERWDHYKLVKRILNLEFGPSNSPDQRLLIEEVALNIAKYMVHANNIIYNEVTSVKINMVSCYNFMTASEYINILKEKIKKEEKPSFIIKQFETLNEHINKTEHEHYFSILFDVIELKNLVDKAVNELEDRRSDPDIVKLIISQFINIRSSSDIIPFNKNIHFYETIGNNDPRLNLRANSVPFNKYKNLRKNGYIHVKYHKGAHDPENPQADPNSDCGETMILNLLNYLLYDDVTDTLRHEWLPETSMEKLKEFYKKNNTIEKAINKDARRELNGLIARNNYVLQNLDFVPDNVGNYRVYSVTDYKGIVSPHRLNVAAAKSKYVYDENGDLLPGMDEHIYSGYTIRPGYLTIIRILNVLLGSNLFPENRIMRIVNSNSLKQLLLLFRRPDIDKMLSRYRFTSDSPFSFSVSVSFKDIVLSMSYGHAFLTYGDVSSDSRKREAPNVEVIARLNAILGNTQGFKSNELLYNYLTIFVTNNKNLKVPVRKNSRLPQYMQETDYYTRTLVYFISNKMFMDMLFKITYDNIHRLYPLIVTKLLLKPENFCDPIDIETIRKILLLLSNFLEPGEKLYIPRKYFRTIHTYMTKYVYLTSEDVDRVSSRIEACKKISNEFVKIFNNKYAVGVNDIYFLLALSKVRVPEGRTHIRIPESRTYIKKFLPLELGNDQSKGILKLGLRLIMDQLEGRNINSAVDWNDNRLCHLVFRRLGHRGLSTLKSAVSKDQKESVDFTVQNRTGNNILHYMFMDYSNSYFIYASGSEVLVVPENKDNLLRALNKNGSTITEETRQMFDKMLLTKNKYNKYPMEVYFYRAIDTIRFTEGSISRERMTRLVKNIFKNVMFTPHNTSESESNKYYSSIVINFISWLSCSYPSSTESAELFYLTYDDRSRTRSVKSTNVIIDFILHYIAKITDPRIHEQIMIYFNKIHNTSMECHRVPDDKYYEFLEEMYTMGLVLQDDYDMLGAIGRIRNGYISVLHENIRYLVDNINPSFLKKYSPIIFTGIRKVFAEVLDQKINSSENSNARLLYPYIGHTTIDKIEDYTYVYKLIMESKSEPREGASISEIDWVLTRDLEGNTMLHTMAITIMQKFKTISNYNAIRLFSGIVEFRPELMLLRNNKGWSVIDILSIFPLYGDNHRSHTAYIYELLRVVIGYYKAFSGTAEQLEQHKIVVYLSLINRLLPIYSDQDNVPDIVAGFREIADKVNRIVPEETRKRLYKELYSTYNIYEYTFPSNYSKIRDTAVKTFNSDDKWLIKLLPPQANEQLIVARYKKYNPDYEVVNYIESLDRPAVEAPAEGGDIDVIEDDLGELNIEDPGDPGDLEHDDDEAPPVPATPETPAIPADADMPELLEVSELLENPDVRNVRTKYLSHGSSNYKEKYLKYKTKYIALKEGLKL